MQRQRRFLVKGESKMAIRNIVQVGDDILRKKCFEVENFDEKLG